MKSKDYERHPWPLSHIGACKRNDPVEKRPKAVFDIDIGVEYFVFLCEI